MPLPTLVARPPEVATREGAPAGGSMVRIHVVGRLAQQLTCADVWARLSAAADGSAGQPIVVVDARFPETYAVGHLPGAINLPWRTIDRTTTAAFPRQALVVVYCWNPKCHASTKAASRLESLGFQVKEMPGGLETWRREGYPTETA